MVVRTALSLLALVVIAWTAVLLRDLSLGQDAANRSFFVPGLGAEQHAADREALADARLLNPSRQWSVAHAYNLLVAGERVDAVREAEALVRAEPENPAAWGLLRTATQESDPARAAQAQAQVETLNPFGSR